MRLHLALLLFIFSTTVFAQTDVPNDKYRGTWEYGTPGNPDEVYAKLEIAAVNDFILHPAKLTLSINEFHAEYHLLLVRKNIRQIAIGHPKKIISETPYSTGNAMLQLNGVFDLQTDRNGKSFLTINRQRFKKVKLNKKFANPGEERTSKLLNQFLEETNFRMYQVNDSAWIAEPVEAMLHSPYSGFYYGKKDTLGVKSMRGVTKFSGKNSGIVSVSLNGRTVFDMGYANDKSLVNEIKLEPGINMLAVFVEQYGKKPQQTANLELDFFTNKTSLNFSAAEDFTSTCIVLPIIYRGDPDTSKTKLNNLRAMKEQLLAKKETIYYYPDENNRPILNDEVQKTLLRQSTVVGNITTKSREVLLGLWDDAVEDGDSISLNINGTWVVQGMPVLKRPQFISVKLNGGVNKIIFIADNQGSIIPNTSMLEIIDDHQRKSFKINTDFHQNNLINILYELPPDSKP